MNTLRAFYHRTRREFVSLMTREVAVKIKRTELQAARELINLAREGFVKGVIIPGNKTARAWELTPAGKAQAEQIIRAEALAKSV